MSHSPTIYQPFRACVEKRVPTHLAAKARQVALEINPDNIKPRLSILPALAVPVPKPLSMALPSGVLPPARLTLMNSVYWGAGGVDLTVGFYETLPLDLRERILSHFNIWGAYANIRFSYTNTSPQVRVTRSGGGYWSYLGTDILVIPESWPTMSLQGFTMSSPESEFKRVIRHEVGHTLGFHHEHLRPEIVERLDVQKTLDYFYAQYGWGPEDVYWNVLTPLNPSDYSASELADERSIMCYTLPGEITTDGEPILGGKNLTATDKEFVQECYPGIAFPEPPPPPPPPSGFQEGILVGDLVWIDRPPPQNSAVEFPYPSSGLDNYISFPGVYLGVDTKFSVFASLKLQHIAVGNSFALLYKGDDLSSIALGTLDCNMENYEHTELVVSFQPSFVIVSNAGPSWFNRLMVGMVGRDKKTGEINYIARTTDDIMMEEDEWFSLGVTYSGSGTRAGIKLYYNGLPAAINAGSSSSSKGLLKTRYIEAEATDMRALCGIPTPSLDIGLNLTGGFQGGIVQRLAFFGKALSASAMLDLHKNQVKADAENLFEGVIYKFLVDEGSGATTTDVANVGSFSVEDPYTWNELSPLKQSLRQEGQGLLDSNGTVEFLPGGSGDAFSFVTRLRLIPPTNGTQNWTIFNTTSNSGDTYELLVRFNTPKGFSFSITDGTGSFIKAVSSSLPTRNVWVVLAVTYDGTKTSNGVKLYIDGELVKSTKTNAGVPEYTVSLPRTAPFTVVRGSPVELDWIVGWDRELTPNEVKGASVFDPSNWEPGVVTTDFAQDLFIQYGMNEGSGTTIHNSESTSVDGVVRRGSFLLTGWTAYTPTWVVKPAPSLYSIKYASPSSGDDISAIRLAGINPLIASGDSGVTIFIRFKPSSSSNTYTFYAGDFRFDYDEDQKFRIIVEEDNLQMITTGEWAGIPIWDDIFICSEVGLTLQAGSWYSIMCTVGKSTDHCRIFLNGTDVTNYDSRHKWVAGSGPDGHYEFGSQSLTAVQPYNGWLALAGAYLDYYDWVLDIDWNPSIMTRGYGEIDCFYMWQRRLTLDDAQILHQNPFPFA